MSLKREPVEPEIPDTNETPSRGEAVLSYSEGVDSCLIFVTEKLPKTSAPIVISVTGGSASGKSFLADELQQKLLQMGISCEILGQDNYYFGRTFMNEHPEISWDDPQALDINGFNQDVLSLKSSQDTESPIYSFTKQGPDGIRTIPGSVQVLIVEGLFTFQPETSTVTDLKVFVQASDSTRLMRRWARDKERGWNPYQTLSMFLHEVTPRHNAHVQPQREQADLVVATEYATQETEKLSNVSRQAKYALSQSSSVATFPHIPGVSRISSCDQVDHYYVPYGIQRTEEGETLRLRQEGDAWILTYKGPEITSHKGTRDSRRAFLECEIDESMATAFRQLDTGGRYLEIQKHRTLYQLGTLIFSLDIVTFPDGRIHSYIEGRLQTDADEALLSAVVANFVKAQREERNYFQIACKQTPPTR